ncbi:MAG: DUF4417 domain-containing protein, partial [Bacteroidales bacterium]|nr:DUF4417 domain-containing protein [Bacteroidales bacterium]
MDILKDIYVEKHYSMPIVPKYTGKVPSQLIRFNEAMRSKCNDATVHFYIDDTQFMCIQRAPERYLPIMRRFTSTIGPDFSQYVNMPSAIRYSNAFWNRAISAWWSQNGVSVIPNLTWSTPDSYGYSFSGMPRHSIIAIGSMGVAKYAASRYLWQQGYKEMLRQLKPELIIRYGEPFPCEAISCSIYFLNEQLMRGRERSRELKASKKEYHNNQLK